MRTGASVVLLVLAGNAIAQTPAAPASTAAQQSTAPSQRHPVSSHDQFFSPVMGIQIEGQGVTLPKGVAEEAPVKPAAETPPSKPAAVPEPATAAPAPTQK